MGLSIGTAVSHHDEIIKGQLRCVLSADRPRRGFDPAASTTALYLGRQWFMVTGKLSLHPDCLFIGEISCRSIIPRNTSTWCSEDIVFGEQCRKARIRASFTASRRDGVYRTSRRDSEVSGNTKEIRTRPPTSQNFSCKTCVSTNYCDSLYEKDKDNLSLYFHAIYNQDCR